MAALCKQPWDRYANGVCNCAAWYKSWMCSRTELRPRSIDATEWVRAQHSLGVRPSPRHLPEDHIPSIELCVLPVVRSRLRYKRVLTTSNSCARASVHELHHPCLLPRDYNLPKPDVPSCGSPAAIPSNVSVDELWVLPVRVEHERLADAAACGIGLANRDVR